MNGPNNNGNCNRGKWELCGAIFESESGTRSRVYGATVYQDEIVSRTYLPPKYYDGGCFIASHRIPFDPKSDLNSLFVTDDPFQRNGIPTSCAKPQ